MSEELSKEEHRLKSWDEGDLDLRMDIDSLMLHDGDFEKYQPRCYLNMDSIEFKKLKLKALREFLRWRFILSRHLELFEKEFYVNSDDETFWTGKFLKLHYDLAMTEEEKEYYSSLMKKLDLDIETGENLTYQYVHLPHLCPELQRR